METPRLLLRPLTLADADDYFGIVGDPLAMRYYPQIRDRAYAEQRIAAALERYARGEHDFWAVTLKSSGEFLGVCGLKVQIVEGAPENEIGYLFLARHWHHGYATEAASAWRNHAFNVLGYSYVISLIRPENEPSQRVAMRVGMARGRQVEYQGILHDVWRLDRQVESEQTLKHSQ